MATFLAIFGSLGLFLFGMRMLSESMQKYSGHRLRQTLRTMTKDRFRGLFCGFGVTTLIQSSSATTVLVVSFVNAGLLTLAESAGVILGANVGTTTTAWIISLFGFKFSITSLAIPLAGFGMTLILFAKRPRIEVSVWQGRLLRPRQQGSRADWRIVSICVGLRASPTPRFWHFVG